MAPGTWVKHPPKAQEKKREPRGSLLKRRVLMGRREACQCAGELVSVEVCPECLGKGSVIAWMAMCPEWEAAL